MDEWMNTTCLKKEELLFQVTHDMNPSVTGEYAAPVPLILQLQCQFETHHHLCIPYCTVKGLPGQLSKLLLFTRFLSIIIPVARERSRTRKSQQSALLHTEVVILSEQTPGRQQKNKQAATNEAAKEEKRRPVSPFKSEG